MAVYTLILEWSKELDDPCRWSYKWIHLDLWKESWQKRAQKGVITLIANRHQEMTNELGWMMEKSMRQNMDEFMRSHNRKGLHITD